MTRTEAIKKLESSDKLTTEEVTEIREALRAPQEKEEDADFADSWYSSSC